MTFENQNDTGNAERLARLYEDLVRYCDERGEWYSWDGRRWAALWTPGKSGIPGRIYQFAQATIRKAQQVLETLPGDHGSMKRFFNNSLNERPLGAMVRGAGADKRIAVSADDLRDKPGHLNAQNGTVDLRTGTLRPHQREDMMTKLVHCEYDPQAEAPLWREMVRRAFKGDQEMIDYFQRALGYTFTGEGDRKGVYICHGPQDTGKSTLLQVVAELMREYCADLRAEHFMGTKDQFMDSDKALQDLSACDGARFALIQEGPPHGKWNCTLVKQANPGGNGRIKVRKIYGSHYTIPTSFAIWVDTNHMPNAGSMEGVQNRFKIIRFENRLRDSEKRVGIGKQLREEWPGILAWLVEGGRQYYAHGLQEPAGVGRAVQEYVEQQNSLERWRNDCLITDPQGAVKSADLKASYRLYCSSNDLQQQTDRELMAAYERWGLSPWRTRDSRGYRGVRLYDQDFEMAGEEGENTPILESAGALAGVGAGGPVRPGSAPYEVADDLI
jgi:putative DNA primase/helicase